MSVRTGKFTVYLACEVIGSLTLRLTRKAVFTNALYAWVSASVNLTSPLNKSKKWALRTDVVFQPPKPPGERTHFLLLIGGESR